MSNDGGKVRVDPYVQLVFGKAASSSTDPLVILLRTVLKDGKLGIHSVDKNTLDMTEQVYGKTT